MPPILTCRRFLPSQPVSPSVPGDLPKSSPSLRIQDNFSSLHHRAQTPTAASVHSEARAEVGVPGLTRARGRGAARGRRTRSAQPPPGSHPRGPRTRCAAIPEGRRGRAPPGSASTPRARLPSARPWPPRTSTGADPEASPRSQRCLRPSHRPSQKTRQERLRPEPTQRAGNFPQRNISEAGADTGGPGRASQGWGRERDGGSRGDAQLSPASLGTRVASLQKQECPSPPPAPREEL